MSEISHRDRCTDRIGIFSERIQNVRLSWGKRVTLNPRSSMLNPLKCYSCPNNVSIGELYYIKDGNKHRKLRHLECAQTVGMLDNDSATKVRAYLAEHPKETIKVFPTKLESSTGITLLILGDSP